MKVLHVFKTYLTETFGGIEQVIYQLCKESSLNGVENKILCLSKKPEPKIISRPEAEVHRYKLNFELASNSFSFSAIFGFIELAKWADIIHYHFPWPSADLLHFMSRVKKPSVVSYHSDIVKQKFLLKLYQPLMHSFLNSANTIVASSTNYLQSSEILQSYKEKIVIIPYGLDKNSYPIPSKEKTDYWRRQFGEDFFLFVGVLRYYKGLHILLETLVGSDFRVLIVGQGYLEKELKEKAIALKLKNVHFLNAIDDENKVALLQLCKAFVFPSHLRSEAFGLSLLEAAMFGKPMISAEIGTGGSYVNVNGETGVVVRPNDPDELRHAMKLIANNRDLAKKMGENAEKRYWDLFTANRMAREYVAIYKTLYNN